MSFFYLIPLCLGAYLIGNVNFAIIVSNLLLRKDVRRAGSGNPGATNMLRNFGFKWGLLVLVLDMMKGAIPALVGLLLYGIGTEAGRIALFACGLAVIMGHCYPALYRFRGGKGVATTVGVFFVANPALAAIALAGGMLFGAVFEYASVSSILFITAVVLWEGFANSNGTAVSVLLMVFYFLILFTHRQNIKRLVTGTENRASLLGRIVRKRIKAKQDKWLHEWSSQKKCNES